MDPSSLPPPHDLPFPPLAPPPLPSVPRLPPTSATITDPTHINNNPPYSEMINAAITALKEKDGSSKRAIAKYIGESYTNLPPNHSALLTHHLNRLKNSGFLVMVKKSYKLSTPDATLPPNDDVSIPITTTTRTASATHGTKTGRGRGRPRKASTSSVLVADKPKRGRGRPKKSDGPVQRSPKKRRPGRPKKPKTVKGRPVQVSVQAQDQLNPVTVSNVASDANLHVPMPGVPRPRGRPRKVGTSADAGWKQLGRPPKKLKNSTGSGRPVGRPKKTISSALTEAAEAQAQSIADLKRKLEFFQSKVKQAVGVLKPQLNIESQNSAVSTIQELEALASMDINALLREDTQQQPQPPLVQS